MMIGTLENFFGFCLAEITTPKNILKPLLPYKFKGKTIFPTGTWIGVYFSEELKEVVDRGYKVKLIKGYEFSKIDLFTDYVYHFYDLKKLATGAERWIAKMHLNQLYGIFGRRKDLIETINIFKKDLPKYMSTKVVKNVVEINDDIYTILIKTNVNTDILKELNAYFESHYSNSFSEVQSNVAIAAAVTAYARIHMMPYRLDPNTLYTDTDSIFTTKELPSHLIGSDLGLMKDELKGCFIKQAYFLGIKRYGYWFIDSNNNRVEQSVFAGVTRNSITFDEIISLFKGGSLSKFVPNRFYKSFKDLNISIKSVNVTVKMNHDKILIDNNYIPTNVFNLNHELDSRSYFLKLKNKLIRFLKHY